MRAQLPTPAARRRLAALSLVLVVPLATSACVTQVAQAVFGFETRQIRNSLAELPGVDTEARAADGTRLFAVTTRSDRWPMLDVSVPVHDTLTETQFLEIFTSASAAIRAEDVAGEITFVRRSGSPSESSIRELLLSSDRIHEHLRYWWEASSQADVRVLSDIPMTDADLWVDASGLPDHASGAVPGIDRLKDLLDNPPPEHFSPEREVWTVRDRGPEVSLTARAAHLLDQQIWDGLTVPALNGLVESIKINDRSAFYRGHLMASERGVDHRIPSEAGEDSPPVATLHLADRSSPLLEPDAVRALHAVSGLRYLRLPLDIDSDFEWGYTIDLEMCSAEVSEQRLDEETGGADNSEGTQSHSAPATLTRQDKRPSTTTTPTTHRPAPRGASDEANEAAWALWRLLGCE